MYGYIKLGAAVPKTKVCDCVYNREQIVKCIKSAALDGIKILVFPELAVTSYTCGDMFLQKHFIDRCEESIRYIAEQSKGLDVLTAVGVPVMVNSRLYNCAAVMLNGKVIGITPKEVLPEHGEYYEKRWFASGSHLTSRGINSINYCGYEVPFGNILYKCLNYDNVVAAVEICADFWSVNPPSSQYCLMGATVILNPSASPNSAGKMQKRRLRVGFISDNCKCAYAYTSSSVGESTADSIFDGQALIANNGKVLSESERYCMENVIISAECDLEDIVIDRMKASDYTGEITMNSAEVSFAFKSKDNVYPNVNPPQKPFAPTENPDAYYEDILNMQCFALMKRLMHTGCKKVLIGISGGLDSTLALLACVRCFDKMGEPREGIIGVTMPGFGTSGRTYENSKALMEALNITHRDIPIKVACLVHFKDIGHDKSVTDTTYENVQARERTQILMDIANKENGIVVGTGDMSELALGWATYNGDHMSMYGVNAGIPKTVIKEILKYVTGSALFGDRVNTVLYDIMDTPVSPELLPTDSDDAIQQKTEDLVGPYELHDYFMYYLIHKGFSPKKTAYFAKCSFKDVYSDNEIMKWLNTFIKRFFMSQFKRSCMPDAPKVMAFSLSQRADLRIPSDVCQAHWLDSISDEGELQ